MTRALRLKLLIIPFLMLPVLLAAQANLSFFAGASAHIPQPEYLSTGFTSQFGLMYSLPDSPLFLEINAGGVNPGINSDVWQTADLSISYVNAGLGLMLKVFDRLGVFVRGGAGIGNEQLVLPYDTYSGGALNYSADAGVRYNFNEILSLDILAGLRTQMNSHIAFESGARLVISPMGLLGSLLNRRDDAAEVNSSQPELSPLETSSEQNIDDGHETAIAADGNGSGDEQFLTAPQARLVLPSEMVSYTDGVLSLDQAGFSTIFPVLYRYYNQQPTGLAVIRNETTGTLENIELLVNVPAYMDLPQRQVTISRLRRGEQASIDLQVLFNNNLLDVTEGTQVAAQFIVRYQRNGSTQQFEVDTVLRVENRNAMTWDDDRKAASFVTARDPEVLEFARSASGVTRINEAEAMNPALLSAMALFQALNAYDLDYVIDPTTPYAQLSAEELQIDFLQFPVQTLRYGAGDCDDLSILYAAMLEAVGVETAFVTIPGHIYLAFNTKVPSQNITDAFPTDRLVIDYNGSGWIPVEVTMLQDGFLSAWQTGGRNWSRYSIADQAKMYPLHQAWEMYPPVGFDTGGRNQIDALDENLVQSQFSAQLQAYIEEAISAEQEPVLQSINRRGESATAYNRLGIIYAVYGDFVRARQAFNRALVLRESSQTYINLGNLYFIEGDFSAAIELYLRAYALNPQNPILLKNLTLALYEVGETEDAEDYFALLESQYPLVAGEIAFVQGGNQTGVRASAAQSSASFISWQEGETNE